MSSNNFKHGEVGAHYGAEKWRDDELFCAGSVGLGDGFPPFLLSRSSRQLLLVLARAAMTSTTAYGKASRLVVFVHDG
jgi:hypothetical protein